MTIKPLDLRKATFQRKVRGYDSQEVDDYLALVSEELAARLGDIARIEQENRELRLHLDAAGRRQNELQETMLQAQRLSQEITKNAKREGEILVREAEITADVMVQQAIEQAQKIEAKILELRAMRRNVQLKLRNTLDLYQRLLDEDIEEERTTATVHVMPRQARTS